MIFDIVKYGLIALIVIAAIGVVGWAIYSQQPGKDP